MATEPFNRTLEEEIPEFVVEMLAYARINIRDPDHRKRFFDVVAWALEEHDKVIQERLARDIARRQWKDRVWSITASILSGLAVAIAMYLLITKYKLL